MDKNKNFSDSNEKIINDKTEIEEDNSIESDFNMLSIIVDGIIELL